MKVIGYIRVSTNNQDLTRQKQLIAKWCNSNNYTLKRIIGEKISGAKNDREGLNELLQVNSKETDVIAVSELSRISRADDIMDVISQLNSIRKNGVSLYILDTDTWIKYDEDIDGLGVMKLVFTAMGNADERKKITNRMTTGRYTKILENPNAYVGGIIPYGFEIVDNPNYEFHKTAKSLLKINEKEADNIRMMYSKIVNEGFTLSMLTKYCIDNKIQFVKDTTSKDSYLTTLARMLKNPIYKGKRIYKGETFDIEGIVDETLWQSAKDALKANRLYTSDIKRYDLFNPIKGLLKCACGHNMYLSKCKGYYYYKCIHKKTIEDKVICQNNGIKKDAAIKAIWENSKFLTLKEDWDLETSKQEKSVKEDIDIITGAYVKLRSDYAKIEREKEEIVKKIELMESTELIGIFSKKYEELDKKRKEVFKDIVKKENEVKQLQNKLEQLKETTKEMKLDALDEETKSIILHNIIDKVVWHSDKLRSGYLIFYYKNGIQVVSMVCTTKKHNFIYQLDSGYRWDEEKQKVYLDVYVKKEGATFGFEMGKRYYTFEELKEERNHLLNDEWVIEENIDHTAVPQQKKVAK